MYWLLKKGIQWIPKSIYIQQLHHRLSGPIPKTNWWYVLSTLNMKWFQRQPSQWDSLIDELIQDSIKDQAFTHKIT